MNNIEMCFLSFITMIVSPFISVVIGKIMVPLLLFMNDYLMVDFLGGSLCVNHFFDDNQSHTFVATYQRFTPFLSQRNGSHFQPDDNPYNPPSAIEIITLYSTSIPAQAVFNVRWRALTFRKPKFQSLREKDFWTTWDHVTGNDENSYMLFCLRIYRYLLVFFCLDVVIFINKIMLNW